MVSNAFFTGSKYLVEDNDGRHDYLRLDGERFLAALSTAGQKVLRSPVDTDERGHSGDPTASGDLTASDGTDDSRTAFGIPSTASENPRATSEGPNTASEDPNTASESPKAASDDPKAAYLAALVDLNESYFAAREYEDDAEGKYFKHDEDAERRFRIRTAERLTECVEELHALLSAHDALTATAVERVERTREGEERRRTRSAVRSTLLACTDLAVSEGWFPVVESYYYSLSPGELVAEDRERRKQRIEGTEESVGIGELLRKPRFERLTERDVGRIRELNRESPGSDSRVWKRLLSEYSWYVSRDRDGTDRRDRPVAAGQGPTQ